MRRYNRVFAFCLAFALFLGAAAMAYGQAQAQAKMIKFDGKVEVKPPAGKWIAAKANMPIAKGSTIATGFKSSAQIELKDAVLYVKQLTRLSLEEIAELQNKVTTRLKTPAGRMEAKVKLGTEYTHDFKVSSPVSTAAVKGTYIIYDGMVLIVTEGWAILFNLLDQPLTVFPGDLAIAGDGFEIFSSKRLRDLKFRVPLIAKRLPGTSGTTDSKFIRELANVSIDIIFQ